MRCKKYLCSVALQDAAFALVEGPPVQEGDVDWEEAAVEEKTDDGDDGGQVDEEEEEEGGLTAYAAGAAAAEQVQLMNVICMCVFALAQTAATLAL